MVQFTVPGARVAVPMTVEPSVKVTVPVAIAVSVVTVAVKATLEPAAAGFALETKVVALEFTPTRKLLQPTSRLRTLIEPSPVASSNPAPTRKPLRPPARLEGPGVLLLQMLGVMSAQPVIPLEATVTSLKAPVEPAAAIL